MLINTVEGQECRIAILENGVLEELYVERASSASQVGNIYKGRVTNVEPAIQAAFVDFGRARNGFLHISDLHPQYFPKGTRHQESVGAKHPRSDRPPIQACLRRGQEVVVQITKEGIGTKGPTLTTYLSLPGRMLVMMPGMSRLGVSKKVEDEEARAKAREILNQLTLPPGMGFILRTAGIERSKRDLQRDLSYLMRLWRAVESRIKTARAPAEIYQESDLVIRTIRDVYNADMDRIICDREPVAFKVQEFLNMAMPRTKNIVEMYVGKRGLFFDAGLEDEIERIYARRVELPSGGSLVIDQTEALVAIDVNSGRFRDHTDAETTALKTDVEAAKEIVRQLRLRDLGGVIIMDFIDLRAEKHRREVERALRDALKRDRAKTKVLRMSNFGIIEMTRQRVRPSLGHSIHSPCAFCGGTGYLKSEESQALHVMRVLQQACADNDTAIIELATTPTIAHHLVNVERGRINMLEQRTGKRIVIRADGTLAGNEIRLSCTDRRGATVAWDQQAAAGGEGKPKKLETVDINKLPRPSERDRHARPDQKPPAGAAPQPAGARPAPAGAAPQQAGAKPAPAGAAPQPTGGPAKKPRRRGRRGGRRRRRKTSTPGAPAAAGSQTPQQPPKQQPPTQP